MNVICQAVSHLWIDSDCPFFQNSVRVSTHIASLSPRDILPVKSFLTSSSPPIMGSFLSFLPLQIQAVVEAEKLRFFPAFNQVPWQCENSYCNIVVLKETIYSGYTESLWRLHGAPCFMLCAHMVGNCSLLDPQTTAFGRWRAEPSYGLSMRVWMCPLGRGMLIYLFLFLNPLLHLGAINHPFAGKNKLNVLQWVYLAIKVKIEEDYCTGNLFAFQNVT